MANPFFQAQHKQNIVSNPVNQDIKQAYQIFSHSKNPQQVFYNMAQRNPQLQPILQMLNKGSDPQQLFYMLCKQKNVNPNDILGMLNGK